MSCDCRNNNNNTFCIAFTSPKGSFAYAFKCDKNNMPMFGASNSQNTNNNQSNSQNISDSKLKNEIDNILNKVNSGAITKQEDNDEINLLKDLTSNSKIDDWVNAYNDALNNKNNPSSANKTPAFTPTNIPTSAPTKTPTETSVPTNNKVQFDTDAKNAKAGDIIISKDKNNNIQFGLINSIKDGKISSTEITPNGPTTETFSQGDASIQGFLELTGSTKAA
jgi:hypothetical protein